MNWILLYICGWIAAMILGLVFSVLARRYAWKIGLVDKPKNEAHKNHKEATPVAGGVAMCSAWLITILAGLGIAVWGKSLLPAGISAGLAGLSAIRGSLLLILAGAVILTLAGMMDDKKPMKAGRKFLWQFAVAAVTAAFGPRITAGLPWPLLHWAITTFWILTIINAINFFDNMDALAGGSAAIAAFFLLITAGVREQYFVATLAAVTGGSISGFLFLNRPPAKMFMGDSGSHFLGYTVALLCIMTTFYLPSKTPTAMPVLIPLLLLGVQLFDAAAVVVIRIHLHKPIYVGDNRHISHRFVHLGLSRPQAVACVLLLCTVCGSSAVTLLWLPPIGAFLVILQILTVLAIISLIQFYIPENHNHAVK